MANLGVRLPAVGVRSGGFLPAMNKTQRPTSRHRLLALALLAAVPLSAGGNLGGGPAVRPASDWLAPGKPTLTLEAADEMASAAVSECRSKGFKDISVYVLDAAGRTLVSKTMINVPNLIPTIAEAKAGAAIGTHSSSRSLKDKYVPDRTPQLLAMTTLGASVQQPFAAVPGGVLCRDAESGAVIGAIGVSGASADEDEHMAIVGAQACGFKTEPATSALN
jgi:glc operon protein GlcG